MATTQPKWHCIAQLGDVNPLDYGGYWIFEDATGVYPPEAEYLAVDDDDDGRLRYTAYRFALDRCTYADGILSDNPYHPDHPAWFAKPESERATRPQDTTYLADVAKSIGSDVGAVIAALCSDDPRERAHAYRAVGDYHGWDNLDSYPLQLSRTEARRRYALAKYRAK
jgi:hypothetical protein